MKTITLKLTRAEAMATLSALNYPFVGDDDDCAGVLGPDRRVHDAAQRARERLRDAIYAVPQARGLR